MNYKMHAGTDYTNHEGDRITVLQLLRPDGYSVSNSYYKNGEYQSRMNDTEGRIVKNIEKLELQFFTENPTPVYEYNDHKQTTRPVNWI